MNVAQKLEHSVDKAHEALNASQADFEFHIEDGRLQQNYARARKQRWVQLAFAIVVPLIMALIGLYSIDLARKAVGANLFYCRDSISTCGASSCCGGNSDKHPSDKNRRRMGR